jgi:hypothetical protein
MLPRSRPDVIRLRCVKSRLLGLVLTLLTALALVGLSAGQASATNSFANASIADQGLSHLGQNGGTCKQFANNMVSAASGGTVNIADGYYASYSNSGGTLDSASAAVKGDIIQLNNMSNPETYYNGMHTAIIVSNLGNNTFDVVDSNWGSYGTVKEHNWNPYTTANQYGLTVNIWRLGKVDAPSWGGVGTASFLGTDTLGPGKELDANQYILSADARFALILQTDGNLVLYDGNSIWQSGTSGSGANRLVMQTDGNLVLYNGNTAVWQSRTGGTGQAHLVVQTDGNVVTYNNASGSPTWWTGTGGHAAPTPSGLDTLAVGHELDSQQYMRSSNMRYGLLLQSDGNLVLYGPGYHVLWYSGTSGATRLVMQTDGNLVLYNINTSLWQTMTSGTGSTHAVMQSDGNFVVYTAGNTPTWQTGTNGRL